MPSEIKELIDMGIFDDVIKEAVLQYQLTAKQQVLLENETLLVLMGLSGQSELTEHLQKALDLDNTKAALIYGYLKQELFDLAYEPLEEAERQLAMQSDSDEVPETTRTASKTAEPVQSIRTMPSDVKRVHGYGAGLPPEEEVPTYSSTQADIVRDKNPE